MQRIVIAAVFTLFINPMSVVAQETDRATELRARAEAAYVQAVAYALDDLATTVASTTNVDDAVVAHLVFQGEMYELKLLLRFVHTLLADVEALTGGLDAYDVFAQEFDVALPGLEQDLDTLQDRQRERDELFDLPPPPPPLTFDDIMPEGYEPPPTVEGAGDSALQNDFFTQVEIVVSELEAWVDARRTGRDPYEDHLRTLNDEIFSPPSSLRGQQGVEEGQVPPAGEPHPDRRGFTSP